MRAKSESKRRLKSWSTLSKVSTLAVIIGHLTSLIEKHREKLVDWLGPVTDSEHEDLCKRRDAESANWILDKPEYGLWLTSESSSFLWLNGIRMSCIFSAQDQYC